MTRIDAATGSPQGEPIAAGRAPGALAVTRTGVLVLDSDLGQVVEINPDSLRVSRVLRVGGFPASIAVGDGAAWVVDPRAGTVTRIPG